MAVPETWAQEPQSGAGESAHAMPSGDSSKYADTDRFGKTETEGFTRPIMEVDNTISSGDWGIQAPTGTPSSSVV